MDIIDIHPSYRAREYAAVLWLAGLLLVALQDLQWGWLIQLVWSTTLLHAARNSVGLGSGSIRLVNSAEGWQVVGQVQREPLLGIQAGLVRPRIVTGTLQTPKRRLALFVMADSTSNEQQHWRLRRLMIEG